jgi:hypothetical protein
MPTNIVFGLRLALGSELLHWTPNPFRLNPNPFHMDPNPFQINPNPFHSTRCPLRRESEIPGVSLQVWYLLSLGGGHLHYNKIHYTTLHHTNYITPHHTTLLYTTLHYYQPHSVTRADTHYAVQPHPPTPCTRANIRLGQGEKRAFTPSQELAHNRARGTQHHPHPPLTANGGSIDSINISHEHKHNLRNTDRRGNSHM